MTKCLNDEADALLDDDTAAEAAVKAAYTVHEAAAEATAVKAAEDRYENAVRAAHWARKAAWDAKVANDIGRGLVADKAAKVAHDAAKAAYTVYEDAVKAIKADKAAKAAYLEAL